MRIALKSHRVPRECEGPPGGQRQRPGVEQNRISQKRNENKEKKRKAEQSKAKHSKEQQSKAKKIKGKASIKKIKGTYKEKL